MSGKQMVMARWGMKYYEGRRYLDASWEAALVYTVYGE